MATTLTTPVTVNAPHASVDSVQIDLRRNSDNSVDMAGSTLSVDLVFRQANGTVLRRDVIEMPLTDVPGSVKTPGRAFLTAIVAALRASGRLGAGTDTQDF